MKCQKILKCGGECRSVATKADLIAVGVGGLSGWWVEVYDKKSSKLSRVIGRGQLGNGLYTGVPGVAFLDAKTIIV